MEVTDRVNSLIESYLQENGIELVDITYRRGQGGMVLRLLADTEDGITIDECERLNNYLSGLLDRENVIEEHYLLEVSSPGLDRPLVTDKDFTRVMGKQIYVSTYEPIDAKREHEGVLIGMDREGIVVESHGISAVIPRAKIARARLKIEA